MSPCLFILGAEVLSRGLIYLIINKKTIPFSKPNNFPVICHLIFADDMMIFSNGSKQYLLHLMQFLALYEKKSGRLISKGKSCYIVVERTGRDRCQIIEAVTGFQKKSFISNIWVCSLFTDRKKI